ncbi:hypothetical protein [Sediminibacillus massiliensis]|uniref:hypothetical protein n=1 Tax=Sediminibacillus massiliensis TaxID=1926277 RepID=UPI0009886D58|nr:hypothetical protein [Sediminibacillus massiliensis]
MKVTRFDSQLWQINTFSDISYNKKASQLTIYFFDGTRLDFSEVDELAIFQFLISAEKETFINKVLLPSYPYIQQTKRLTEQKLINYS